MERKPQTLEQRAVRRQRAVVARLQRDVPLFLATGLVHAPTIDEAAAEVAQHDASIAKHQASMDAARAEQAARGDEFRALVKALVDAPALAALDARRLTLPTGAEYHADFWRRTLKEIIG